MLGRFACAWESGLQSEPFSWKAEVNLRTGTYNRSFPIQLLPATYNTSFNEGRCFMLPEGKQKIHPYEFNAHASTIASCASNDRLVEESKRQQRKDESKPEALPNSTKESSGDRWRP